MPGLQRYYETVEFLFSPDLLVVGGGVSKKADKFLPKLKLRTPIVPAELQNRAGIIGAAVLAVDESRPPTAVTLPIAPHRPSPSRLPVTGPIIALTSAAAG